MECQGQNEMDCNELNELVKSRDSHALEYFGLTNATDEELEKWDANKLIDVPTVIEFDEDFEPISPFDAGWSLSVEISEPDEEY